MPQKKYLLILICLSAIGLFAGSKVKPLNAVVRIDTTSYMPDFYIPWGNKAPYSHQGSGVVMEGYHILTNAHVVEHATFITVSKQFSEMVAEAKVKFIDHVSDLALLEIANKSFFADIIPFALGETPPMLSKVNVVGYPIGGDGLSITEGIISRIEARSYVYSGKKLLAAQLDAPINPGNSGGPVLYDGEIAGIAFQGNSNGEGLGYMIHTEIIRHFLRDIEDGHVDGFGAINFSFECLHNPDRRRFLKMAENDSGIRIDTPKGKAVPFLKKNDVLLAIDGIKLENNGNYHTARGEKRFFTTLFDKKQLGELTELIILRDGKKIMLKLPISNEDYLIPTYPDGKMPDYYIIGGFVFTVLSHNLIQEYKACPGDFAALQNFIKQNPSEEAVVLTFVLPASVNYGYHYLKNLVLNTVNGKSVNNFYELIFLIESSQEEFLTMTFGANRDTVTLDLAKLRASTPEILKRYHIPADRRISQ